LLAVEYGPYLRIRLAKGGEDDLPGLASDVLRLLDVEDVEAFVALYLRGCAEVFKAAEQKERAVLMSDILASDAKS